MFVRNPRLALTSTPAWHGLRKLAPPTWLRGSSPDEDLVALERSYNLQPPEVNWLPLF